LLRSARGLIGHRLWCILYSRSHCYPLHTLCYCFSLFSCSGSPAALPPPHPCSRIGHKAHIIIPYNPRQPSPVLE
jgi:hypothetical protein